jgi:hypothetical protein
MGYVICIIGGFVLYKIGCLYGSRIGRGEVLALLIAHPELSAQELRDHMDELAYADNATFEEKIGRWAVKNCDERVEFFKSIVRKN